MSNKIVPALLLLGSAALTGSALAQSGTGSSPPPQPDTSAPLGSGANPQPGAATDSGGAVQSNDSGAGNVDGKSTHDKPMKKKHKKGKAKAAEDSGSMPPQ